MDGTGPAFPRTAGPSARPLELLVQTGLFLSRERDLEKIVQAATDAGRELCRAQFGAFFYNVIDDAGESYLLYTVSGVSREAFSHFPMPRNTAVFATTFSGKGVVRSGDITQDPRYGRNAPHSGMPAGHLPVRSYLAVPVVSRSGEVLGGLFFGHSECDKFEEESEGLVQTVAAQAAVAIENFRLHDELRRRVHDVEVAEKTMRENSSRLRLALDAGQLGTWSWNAATDALDLDSRAAEILDWHPHEPVTRSELRERIVIPEDRRLTVEALRASVDTGVPYLAEYRVHRTDGSVSWVIAHGVPLFANGDPKIATGMIGIVQDITPRKVQEQALRQSEKLAATGRMAATIAHEINNPLEAVANLIFLARTSEDIPHEVREHLDVADQELRRVSLIAQQTLGFYRDSSQPAIFDIEAAARDVISLFQRRMQYKQIACSLEVPQPIRLLGLQGEIRQAISNLLVNAIDASPSQQTIVVRIRRTCMPVTAQPAVSIVVSDRGSGIPVVARRSLFSPFFTTKLDTGTGLGLWVTRGIVEKHGGTIRFHTRSNAPTGTVFRILLPNPGPLAVAA